MATKCCLQFTHRAKIAKKRVIKCKIIINLHVIQNSTIQLIKVFLCSRFYQFIAGNSKQPHRYIERCYSAKVLQNRSKRKRNTHCQLKKLKRNTQNY